MTFMQVVWTICLYRVTEYFVKVVVDKMFPEDKKDKKDKKNE